ncbi:homocysteine S-methyltransferase family protein [Candidatus Parcubacteria bacterium]|nr:homocysteine S-methyltransferase family protein [Candidatus Parcubacteria bacterium]
MSQNESLLKRLQEGSVLCAEGYIFELERRGYVKAGAFVPEVLLEHPEVVRQLHHEFVRAGSDVTLALTYYAHREKLKAIGRENDLEAMNRAALKIASEVAKETGTLFAGDICNTSAYDVNNKAASDEEVRRQYTEQLQWAVDAGVDFVLAETLEYVGEALVALEVIKKHNLPAVINFASNLEKTKDDYDLVEACKILKDNRADVVGFNCSRGPAAMLPLLKRLREAVVGPISALPVAYRTSPANPSFQSLKNSDGQPAYTLGLDEFLCTRKEMADFAAEAQKLGVSFIGICCGAGPHHVRAMAEALGRTVLASKYSPDMSQHYLVGSADYAKKHEEQFIDHFAGK